MRPSFDFHMAKYESYNLPSKGFRVPYCLLAIVGGITKLKCPLPTFRVKLLTVD